MRQILVVDDESLVREVLEVTLVSFGYGVQTAHSGSEALALIENNRFDLVITDYLMDDMKGDELASAIKKRHPNELIILLSGMAQEMEESGKLPPCVDFLLHKPIRIEELRLAVQRILGPTFTPGNSAVM